MLAKCKNVNFMHFNKIKNTYISVYITCKIVHIYKNVIVSVHTCTVTVTLHLIFYYFFLSFSL